MCGLGHHDLVHKIKKALRAFRFLFFGRVSPVFSSCALPLFRASGFGTSTMGQRRFATGGQRHCDLGVATEIELREQAQRKKTGTDGEGGKVSVLLRLEEKNRVFSDRREARFSSTESARKKIILQAPRSHACLSQLIFLRREGGRAGFYR